MVSRNQAFILLCALCFLLIGAGYFLAVDRVLIPRHPVPKSYRHFMLLASNAIPDRLIVDSGSNAIFGIDIAMLEKATARASFNIADSGGYPLEHKIYRLQKNLNPGDLVILPLEWLHYSDDHTLHANYVTSLVDKEAANAFYYHGLPFWQRLKFTFMQLPYHLAAESLHARIIQNLKPGNQRLTIDKDLQKLRGKIDNGDRGSDSGDKRLALKSLTEALSCSQYLFGFYLERFTLSDQFLDNLELLQKVQSKTGAQFVFTWPTVVAKNDTACYTEATLELLQPHAARIQSLVENAGFAFLGHYSDSEYSSDCIRDTYYHVIHQCAVARTNSLIAQLAATGIATGRGYKLERANQALLDAWSELATNAESLD